MTPIEDGKVYDQREGLYQTLIRERQSMVIPEIHMTEMPSDLFGNRKLHDEIDSLKMLLGEAMDILTTTCSSHRTCSNPLNHWWREWNAWYYNRKQTLETMQEQEQMRHTIRQAALAKLTEDEIRILGIK